MGTRSVTARWYGDSGRRIVHSEGFIAADRSIGMSSSKKPVDRCPYQRPRWSAFISVAVSVLSITAVAGIVAAEEPDAMKRHNDKVSEERRLDVPAPQTEYRNIAEYKAQTPPQRLQTDRAMEQASRALDEMTRSQGRGAIISR